MYTIQSLWTMAREHLDVTVVLFNNRSYGILNMELARVGADGGGSRAKAQLDLSNPDFDLVRLAAGFGVASERADTGEQLTAALERAIAEPGPHVIEVLVPNVYSARQLQAMPHALRVIERLPRPIASALTRRLAS
jgi:acetolactate synthase-1/2/3 large subunit